MTDRPILFSGPMVRALLDGRKTQTRRVIARGDGEKPKRRPVNYSTGDRLWVRERLHRDPNLWKYAADGEEVGWPARRDLASRVRDYLPSIHMPRWASRLTLTMTDVRVQRLQEIGRDDALAEGVDRLDPTPEDWEWYRGYAEENGMDPNDPDGVGPVWLAPGTRQGYGPRKNDPQWGPTPQFAFQLLWDSINAARGYGWQANPWVCAISFRCTPKNIDSLTGDE